MGKAELPGMVLKRLVIAQSMISWIFHQWLQLPSGHINLQFLFSHCYLEYHKDRLQPTLKDAVTPWKNLSERYSKILPTTTSERTIGCSQVILSWKRN